jgi:hypothetical protein
MSFISMTLNEHVAPSIKTAYAGEYPITSAVPTNDVVAAADIVNELAPTTVIVVPSGIPEPLTVHPT